jgi:hypothetical protein
VTKLVLDTSDPAAAPSGTGKLKFVPKEVHVRSMLFELNADVAPNWFGVAVPDGITDFTRPTIFFHPTPGPAGYVDGPGNTETTYFGKSKPADQRTPAETKWHELYAYIDRLGQQLAAAVLAGATPNQVVILPFMTTKRMGTAGIFPANWLPIVTDILIGVRAAVTGVVAPLTVSEVVLAGYSAGFGTMLALRNSAAAAPTLNPRLKQILDFDGFPKSSSTPVVTTASVKVWKYVEVSAGTPDTIVVPHARWTNFPQPPPDEEPELPLEKDSVGTILDNLWVHHLIRDTMFLDAALRR